MDCRLRRPRIHSPPQARSSYWGRSLVLLVLVVGLAQWGCRTPAPPPIKVVPYRATDFLDQGDPARRASMRLVVQGLESDERPPVSGRAGFL